LLRRLLDAVSRQRTDGVFDYSTVVVDNDAAQSARGIVSAFQESHGIHVAYYCEPEQNISLARNLSIEKAPGNFVAFIDDDEFPEEDWLLAAYCACAKYKADGVLGPVRPHFQTPPPNWIVKGGFFSRPSFATGSVIRDLRHTRTGNVLLRRPVFGDEVPFEPRFGRIGGEDKNFFGRKIAAGGVFVWCDEAIVYETVPEDRWRRGHLLRSAFVRGVSAAMRGRLGVRDVCKSLVAIALYTAALPMLLVTGHHRFMKVLIKDCDHISKLVAACGVVLIKERVEVRSEGA
jgi:glycosyltransferase involved in cell wall biosynthesis